MGILFKNRLSGEETATPEREAFLSQWVVSKTDSGVFLNTAPDPINGGDFLIPNAKAQWSLLNKEDGQQQSGVFDKHLLPDELEAVSIRAIGKSLEELSDQNANWKIWRKVSPLVPSMSERIEIQPFEKKIRKHIGHLEQIFRKPKAHLWTEIQRVLLSRARRIPHQAANYLAAHTEDWERPTLRGVLPKRILAMVTEDHWNIYENQVAVRLTDHLHTYLNRRVTEVRRLLNIFEEIDYSGSAAGIYLRRNRIYKLWGEIYNDKDANVAYQKTKDTLKELEYLKYKIAGLKDTFLYREIPRRTSVSNTLKITNIFVNDLHYRHVAVLWKEWSKQGIAKAKTPQDVYDEYQELCRSFDSFCLLLTLRAFDQLKFEPSDSDLETPIKKEANLPLFGSICEASVKWNDDGVISVEKDDSILLRLIPLVSALGANPTGNIVERHLDTISNAVSSDPLTIVLYLPSPESRETRLPVEIQKRLHTIGNDLPQGQKKVGFLPVSPWEIGSVERVARAIRWVLWGSEFLKYPPEIEVPATVNLPDNLGWMMPVESDNSYKILRLPRDNERTNISLILNNVRRQLEDRLNISQCSRNNAVSAAQRNLFNNQIAGTEADIEQIRKIEDDLAQAYEYLNHLLCCPVCSSVISPWFFQYGNDLFSCTCSGCGGAIWGIKICRPCGNRFPFLLPQLPNDNDRQAGWVDQVIGMDVLAVPQSNDDFICPFCG